MDGNPYLYAMEYKASYDLDEIIERNVDQNAELLNYVTAKIGKGIPIKGKNPTSSNFKNNQARHNNEILSAL